MDDETLSAWRALLNAHARVTARVESALAEAGLPPLSWYDVLWPLHRAPGRRLRVGALAEQVSGSYVVITAAGSGVLRKMWPVYERALEDAFAARLRSPRALERALAPLGD